MKLDTYVQSKIRWHLGYNLTSVPAGAQAAGPAQGARGGHQLRDVNEPLAR